MVLAKLKSRSLLFTRRADCTKYKYDVFGNRIEQIEDADGAGAGASVTTRFAWEGAGVLQDAWGNRTSPVGTENWNIWADLNGSNGLVMRYVRGDEVDQLFSRVKADGTVAHYLTDRMQSTRQMLDASGTVANTITYDGFGNVLSETDAAFGDRWKWTGREYNNYTGLQYNRARYFSGESGRWASEDPKRHSGMEPYNLHRYLGNHTVGLNDSSGNDWAGLPGGGPPLHFLPDTGTPPPEMPPLPPRPPGTIAHPVTGEPMVIPDMHILRPRPIDPIFNRDDPINSDDPNRYPPLLPGQPGERPPPGTPGTPGGPGEPSIVLQSKLLELAIDKFVDDSNLTTGSLKELPYARKIIPFYNFLIDLIPSKYLPRPPATGNPDPGFPRPVPGFPGPSVGVSGVSKNGATIKIER